jgi:hypothetical protein
LWLAHVPLLKVRRRLLQICAVIEKEMQMHELVWLGRLCRFLNRGKNQR